MYSYCLKGASTHLFNMIWCVCTHVYAVMMSNLLEIYHYDIVCLIQIQPTFLSCIRYVSFVFDQFDRSSTVCGLRDEPITALSAEPLVMLISQCIRTARRELLLIYST